jgi:hypothetical protein
MSDDEIKTPEYKPQPKRPRIVPPPNRPKVMSPPRQILPKFDSVQDRAAKTKDITIIDAVLKQEEDEGLIPPRIKPGHIRRKPMKRDPDNVKPGYCQCGCGTPLRNPHTARFVPGHNIAADPVASARIKPYQMKPGETITPGGRPRKAVSRAYRDMLERPYPDDPRGRTGAELLAIAMFRKAVQEGDVAAAKEMTDRAEGKVTDKIEIDNSGMEGDVRERIRLLVEKLRGTYRAGNRGIIAGTARELPAGPDGAGEAEANE